jgi:hypothetical protein
VRAKQVKDFSRKNNILTFFFNQLISILQASMIVGPGARVHCR